MRPDHRVRRARRAAVLSFGLTLLGPALLVLPAAPATATPGEGTTGAARTCQASDQLAATIGIPGEAIHTTRNAGAAEVRFGCDIDRGAQALHLPHPHAGDRFGTGIARGYLNDDGWEDVAVGIPGLDVDGHRDAGGVAIFHGSKTGLHYVGTLTQASSSVPGAVSSYAEFGEAVATDGYSADRQTVLRVGEPGKTVAGHRAAGGFVDLAYVRGKLVTAREVTLASTGIPGSPAAGDLLGSALDGTRAVGAPGRTVNGHRGAGEVLIAPMLYGDRPRALPASVITQASPGVAGTPEAGDHFGAALSERWVGAPGESIGTVRDAGVVDRYYDTGAKVTAIFPPIAIVPGSGGVPGTPTPGAFFGAAVAEIGDVVDGSEFVARAVLVGAPGRPVAGRAGAGAVTVAGLDEPDPSEGGTFGFSGVYQTLVDPTPRTGGGFGAAIVGPLDGDTVQVGAPGNGGGRVDDYQEAGNLTRLPLTLRSGWHQEAGVPETGDAFGAALAGPTF